MMGWEDDYAHRIIVGGIVMVSDRISTSENGYVLERDHRLSEFEGKDIRYEYG